MSGKNVPYSERIFVSVSQAVELSGMGRTRIYEEIKSGRLRSKTEGRRRLIFVESLLEWILPRGGSDNGDPVV